MGIQEDIKASKFGNEWEKAIVNVIYTSGWLYSINYQRLKAFDISPEQYNVLRILRGSSPEPLRLNDITERMLDKMSNATRLVEKLRQKGFVKRTVCENNRRAVDIVITDKGLALMKKIDATQDDWMAEFKNITKTEAQELNRILDKMRGK
jgi:DNA-binding MarR family transcriptional regulator